MLELTLGNKKITTERPAFVMGILNVTEDSFFSGSRGGIEKALQIINDGADIIDIGAESTRPGYIPVSPELQIQRLVPVIQEIRKHSDIVISVDTRSAKVFEECYKAGADVLNDVSSFEDDENMVEVLAKTNASVILMHQFRETENRPSHKDCIELVKNYLCSRAALAIKAGISPERILVDPGIGFGKTFEENLMLIKECGILGGGKYPVVMALSRKRCIGTMLQRENTADDRMTGTVTADILSVLKGAVMVRVHDVIPTIDSLNVMKYLQ